MGGLLEENNRDYLFFHAGMKCSASLVPVLQATVGISKSNCKLQLYSRLLTACFSCHVGGADVEALKGNMLMQQPVKVTRKVNDTSLQRHVYSGLYEV